MKVFPSTLCNIYSGSIGDGFQQAIADLSSSSIHIIADDNTAKLCVPKLVNSLPVFSTIVIPASEQHKNLESCRSIWTALIRQEANRQSLILNVGGGMICDIGGFAASCYQRGVRFAHIPTTVLSMADASIGGKLGIDFEGLKNYIGIIRNPSLIWIDPSFLTTLPKQEIVSGLAEVVKHAIIGSRELWDFLEKVDSIDDISWSDIFEKNIPVKLKVVERDFKEEGPRKMLNFGHTIGHALESYYLSKENPQSHGNCVATGMLVEAKISYSTGLLNKPEFESIYRLIFHLLEPIRDSLPTFESLNGWLQKDKKKSGGLVGFSLPDKIGSCLWDVKVEDGIVKESFQWLHTQVQAIDDRLSVDPL